MTHWQVLVGNIGYVCSEATEKEASAAYSAYRDLSRKKVRRAAGEDVTLFKNGEIVKEHIGRNSKQCLD